MRDASTAVLHFNDCAGVGRILVDEAARQGRSWDYLSPALVRPTATPANPLAAKAAYLPYVLRRARHVGRADVVHVHYATSARLLRERGIPRRPYVLHLHGTDIREQWADPAFRDEIQRAVDGARHVYYTNLDTTENARAARPDAEYMPAFIEAGKLPAWQRRGAQGRPLVVFASRWEDVKGADENLRLAAELRRALPADVDLAGLDWGSRAAEAARAGVELRPRVAEPDFVRLLASADVVIGQARPIFAVSEMQALAIGVPVAAVGSRLPRLDGAGTPPAIEGAIDDVVAGVREALDAPEDVAKRLGGKAWARTHHDPAPYIARLDEVYAAAVSVANEA
jgi:hypothetical protein